MIVDSTKLRKKREAKKLTQLDLAEAIGLSQQRICEWETKDSNVKLEYVMKMCDAMEIELSELAKDGTTININNQHSNKIGNNSIVGFNVEVDAFQLQKEFLDKMIATNEFYQNNLTSLMNNLSDLIKKIG
jgi:transcriptional regulator with XRE-family HTH domain